MFAKPDPYKRATGRLKRSFIVVGVFSAVVNLLMLTGPMFMLQVYDRVLSSGSLATLQGLFLIVVAAYAFLGFYDFLRTRVLSRGAYALDQGVGRAAYDLWIRSGLSTAPTSVRPLSDLTIVRGFLSSPAILGFFDLPWIPFYLLIVFIIHPWLGYLAIAGTLVVFVLALFNQLLTHRYTAEAMRMDGSESHLIEQTRRNAEAIIPLGMATRVGNLWADAHREGLAVGQKGGDRSEGFTATSKAFRMLLQSSLLGLGGYLALQQEISAGMIVAASIIAGRALAPVDQVIGAWRNVVRAREAHKRLKALFTAYQDDTTPVGLPDPTGNLTVSNVTKFVPIRTPGVERPPILEQVSFSLEPGDALGVIGPSASGKSTLARILVGAWRMDAGDVRLDGATLDQWQPEAIGRHIGYLPQHLELLSGTIRDNIARFDSEAPDEDVIEAAKMAGVHDMILHLPDGYGTQLGFGLQPLSGGQMQRLGLARAVFQKPKYVVLDEPNANLDASGDEALGKAIHALRDAGSTVIVMAHRPSAIAAVNKVLVLQGGRVAQFGDKADVLQKAVRPTPAKNMIEAT